MTHQGDNAKTQLMAGFALMIRRVFLSLLLPFSIAAQTHAGKPVPEFVPGDECLFCHRNSIGPGWQKNAHGTTVRSREDGSYTLGGRNHSAELKKEGYNKFAILDKGTGAWNTTSFTEKCTGCHNTGIDAKTGSFSAFGLDCYACHGVVDLNHSTDTSLVWLSKKRRDDVAAVTSICVQCHLRESSRSKSTGKPWPNNFVAGDNLWLDYEVDLRKADDAELNVGDRHIYRNVREVLQQASEVTCLSCHSVHGNSTTKHRKVLTNPACLDCHESSGPKKFVKKYSVSSTTCNYNALRR